MDKIDEIKSKFVELSSESTVHGWSHAFKSKHLIAQVIWLIFFVVSTLCSCYFIYRSFEDYYSYDVVTKIDVIYESKSLFPTVSFCTDWPGLSQEPSDFILDCAMNQNSSCAESPKSYFKPFQSKKLGTCYQFNQEQSIYSSQSGIDFGFRVSFKSNFTTLFPIVYVLIHNTSANLNSIKERAYRISPGANYYFNVGRMYTIKMEKPYNDCVKKPTDFDGNNLIINKMNLFNVSYSRDICFDYCFKFKFLENNSCNCSHSENLIQTSELCDSNCMDDGIIKLQEENDNDLCSDYCPFECDTFEYIISTSSYHLPDNGVLNGFKSFDEMQKNYFSFYVYFDQLEYTSHTETAKMLVDDLASNIGGTCGLFIGMSFLSFLEFFEFIIEAFFILSRSSTDYIFWA